MGDRELGQIGYLGVVCVLAAFLLVLVMGCAHAPPSSPSASAVSCAPRPSNYDICAAKCEAADKGSAFIVENERDVACYCRKRGPDA